MSKVVFLEELCKGCLLCTQVCSKKIITQSSRFNKQGYKVVEIKPEDLEKCIACGFCSLVCPDSAIVVYKSVEEKEPENV
ncbi:MAG TPA: (Fe-S)-binding protein [Desulfonauticus sp.]|jgi:2-oxoglutarate ferredoxin oxidoreductase subunit delta|nr:MAG: 2-oxoglutarate ferredoxin oxidoreductase, delta subunit [Desulfonauticus sp. 38_4375]MDK2921649.1 2-oxoglutarate ferredoxin oxidoreductase subunit delta [Desulfonauticus sp.]HCO12102.1 (Fe-S)-binding protein [Desulfonauticus sp.]